MLIEDRAIERGKRWVVVALGGQGGTALPLGRAATSSQDAHVGDQTGGRVAFFLYTDDFKAAYERMKAEGVAFIEDPRRESYGMVVKFADLCGNQWDLLERRTENFWRQ